MCLARMAGPEARSTASGWSHVTVIGAGTRDAAPRKAYSRRSPHDLREGMAPNAGQLGVFAGLKEGGRSSPPKGSPARRPWVRSGLPATGADALAQGVLGPFVEGALSGALANESSVRSRSGPQAIARTVAADALVLGARRRCGKNRAPGRGRQLFRRAPGTSKGAGRSRAGSPSGEPRQGSEKRGSAPAAGKGRKKEVRPAHAEI